MEKPCVCRVNLALKYLKRPFIKEVVTILARVVGLRQVLATPTVWVLRRRSTV
jgi:hypothetical protein